MKRAELPPGCSSLRMEDGTQYKAGRAGGHVEVADHHAAAINRMGGNGDAGLVSAKGGHYLATKGGRVCPSCRWVWQVWTTVCRRCLVATEPE